jgi:hypothetical protein
MLWWHLMQFPSQLLHGEIDDRVHQAFLRYGKGEYNGPAAEITLTKTGKVKVRSTYLYQELVALVFLSVVPVETLPISGVVIGSEKVDDDLTALGIEPGPLRKVRQAKGYTSKIAGDYSVKQISTLYEEIGAIGYVLCTLTTDKGWSHKAKSKIPDPRSTATVDEQMKFCTTRVPAKTMFTDQLVKELIPDFYGDIPQEFTQLTIYNVFNIKGFIFPSNKDELTSKELRLETKRDMVIHRTLRVNETELTKDHEVVV